MWSTIVGVFSVLRALLDFVKYWKNFQREQREREDDRRAVELEKALKDAQSAKTAQEAFDAQKRIANNEP